MKNQNLAVITGAAGGIGAAIAKQLSIAGWRCLLLGRNEQKLIKLCHTLEGEHRYLVADLQEDESCEIVSKLVKDLGGIKLLVNNAGVNQMAPFSSNTQVDIRQQLQVNLFAPIQLTHQLLDQLLSNQGTVVNIGSAYGYIGYPYQSVYCASKFGLRGFSEALSREYEGRLAVKYLAPRATDTAINNTQVRALNKSMGNRMDSTEAVAGEFMGLLESRKRRLVLGYPEKLFSRLNGLLPEVIDAVLCKQLRTIKSFVGSANEQKESSQ
ncbi:SDR family oxidoreductase [Pseudoalteromonas aurantia]|uniref:Short chain dehydrogenase n=1 Tax=Pseudoalteromonas aurantia 208 TaxID=1314867 RepID=A0ABR9EHV3_9GAMM|nr:SDR family oxidoreductase [Pseudoalteromonas aurantia]MBE0370570.1 hypothetical protein [Pseudoalteromonas aurantia 208]